MTRMHRSSHCRQHKLRNLIAQVLCLGTALAWMAQPVAAADWYVAPGGKGTGTAGSPFGSIQQGIDAAQPGDVVRVAAGTYAEALRSARAGTAGAPITVRADGTARSVVVTTPATVLRVDHAYLAFDGLVFDGQYAAADTLDLNTGAHGLVLRNVEVRRSTKDCIDMGAPHGVTIERSLIHRCLNAAGGRTDAHGIVAGAVRDLTIRDTEIHTFSGDALQVDAGRDPAGWDNVRVERSKLWLAPLASPENGFAAGTVPGENAIDTKANASAPRARIVVRDVEAWGFRGGLISNMAAFNIKENVEASLDAVTVHHSEIAFRLRGPTGGPGAWVRIQNSVVHDVDVGVRYEDDIESVRLFNTTFGANVVRAFRAASSSSAGLTVRNVLLLASSKPAEASDASNRAVSAAAFVNASAHDYHLAPGSPAIDAGIAIDGVATDKDGIGRPQGQAFDVGAFEFAAAVAPALDPIDGALEVGASNTLTGTGFTAGSVVKLFVATPAGPLEYAPSYAPTNWSPTRLTWTIPASVPLGNGFGTVQVVNTDRGYAASNTVGALLEGDPADNIPTILYLNGDGLAPVEPGVPLAHVDTVLAAGGPLTITGMGFNNALVNLFSASGNAGPLSPQPGSSSTQLTVAVPASAPTGPVTLQVVNAPYTGNVGSNAVAAVVGAALTVAGVSVAGTVVTVTGTGFSVLSVINLFNRQGTAVVNLGGLNGSAPRIPLTVVSDTRFTFTVPPDAVPGPAFVQVLNPPYIPFSSTGADPDAAFTIP